MSPLTAIRKQPTLCTGQLAPSPPPKLIPDGLICHSEIIPAVSSTLLSHSMNSTAEGRRNLRVLLKTVGVTCTPADCPATRDAFTAAGTVIPLCLPRSWWARLAFVYCCHLSFQRCSCNAYVLLVRLSWKLAGNTHILSMVTVTFLTLLTLSVCAFQETGGQAGNSGQEGH